MPRGNANVFTCYYISTCKRAKHVISILQSQKRHKHFAWIAFSKSAQVFFSLPASLHSTDMVCFVGCAKKYIGKWEISPRRHTKSCQCNRNLTLKGFQLIGTYNQLFLLYLESRQQALRNYKRSKLSTLRKKMKGRTFLKKVWSVSSIRVLENVISLGSLNICKPLKWPSKVQENMMAQSLEQVVEAWNQYRQQDQR